MSYTVSSVNRALHLLEALAELPGSGVCELTEKTGCTKSLTFRLLLTLERRGFITEDAARRIYTLGSRAMLLGDQARLQSQLISAADPFMRELNEDLKEKVLLLVRNGMSSICISLRDSTSPQDHCSVSRRGPLHVGGGPKILLAFAPEEIREAVLGGEMEVFTENTISSRECAGRGAGGDPARWLDGLGGRVRPRQVLGGRCGAGQYRRGDRRAQRDRAGGAAGKGPAQPSARRGGLGGGPAVVGARHLVRR